MGTVIIETVVDPEEAAAVAAVAAETFPLACPSHSTPENIAAHIAANLSTQRFVEYIDDDDRDVIVARDDAGTVIGYALLVHRAPTDQDVNGALTSAGVDPETAAEVSKMYVLPDHHASRGEAKPAHALMDAAIEAANARGAAYAWLGVNDENRRAQKYYRKMGFAQIGTKTFDMNGVVEHDHVMGRTV
ncbi:N-acetyltransferase [Gordonia spumicola]|uniref:N-acetyltransferase n=1 Tax=Gordonia spumicola TaxID=589161 RepID=A0A7I9VB95_9ACTN|nr:GNAT family N-acetyltransferase [Gordonia spumicola]GEE02646.1 N-acetyltransferase [Gordonia spumicola]